MAKEENISNETVNNEEEINLSEDELYVAAIMPRLNTLLEILEEYDLDVKMSIASNGVPCVDVYDNDMDIRMSYFPVGDVSTDSFVLFMRAIVAKDLDTDVAFLDCEAFNAGSIFGYSVLLPRDGMVELRAQIPEKGGMLDDEYYQYVYEMFMQSVYALKDSVIHDEEA